MAAGGQGRRGGAGPRTEGRGGPSQGRQPGPPLGWMGGWMDGSRAAEAQRSAITSPTPTGRTDGRTGGPLAARQATASQSLVTPPQGRKERAARRRGAYYTTTETRACNALAEGVGSPLTLSMCKVQAEAGTRTLVQQHPPTLLHTKEQPPHPPQPSGQGVVGVEDKLHMMRVKESTWGHTNGLSADHGPGFQGRQLLVLPPKETRETRTCVVCPGNMLQQCTPAVQQQQQQQAPSG